MAQKRARRAERLADVDEQKPNEERRPDENSEEFDRFEDLAKKLLGVPKEELDEKRAERERVRRAG